MAQAVDEEGGSAVDATANTAQEIGAYLDLELTVFKGGA